MVQDQEKLRETEYPTLDIEAEVERLARVIYDTPEPLSGDSVGTVIYASDSIYPSGQHLAGNSTSKAHRLATMDVCRTIARSVLEAQRTHKDVHGRSYVSVVPPGHAAILFSPDDQVLALVPQDFGTGEVVPAPNYISLCLAIFHRLGTERDYADSMIRWITEKVRGMLAKKRSLN